jgi:methionyl-tRNA formyltransferase
MASRAVVFAYHDIGARSLRVLHRHGLDVALVVTHRDNPQENIWFESVADVATTLGLPWITPDDPNEPAVVQRIAALAPDFLFSFYYRQMLGPALLATARRGALNLHGSLLPKYRGRAPVNWAVLHGETKTGVTLHYMATKPDAGDIVAQRAVPIGPDDTAKVVFDRLTDATEALLERTLPALIAGTAPRLPNDLAKGSYFGGRRPEDGRIDWTLSGADLHNLVRGVAPPFPGAFTDVGGKRLRVLKTRRLTGATPAAGVPGLFARDGALYLRAGDGEVLAVLDADCEGKRLTAERFTELSTWPPGS